jgi:O-antigen/teichoic acid export membrane protein
LDVPLTKSASALAVGTAFVLAGQVVFVLCGYLLHFFLSRAMDPAAYGSYGLIINVLVWTEYALNNGLPWAVRKLVPAHPEAWPAILRRGLRWQIIVAVGLYAATTLLAPWFTRTIGDTSLIFHLRLALTDILLLALYTYYRGALNSLRLFAAQGASLIAYAVGKLVASSLLVGVGFSLSGALVGNVLGSGVGALAAWALLRRGEPATSSADLPSGSESAARYSGRAMLSFALPMVLFTLAGTFLLNVGLVGVKALVTDGPQIGYYTAANYLASAPTMMLVVFSITLFPHLVASIAKADWPLTRTYIRSAVRYLALVLIPGISLVLGASPQLISLVYPQDYAIAASWLNLLIITTGLYSLFMIFANAMLAENRVGLALSIPCVAVPLSLLSTWQLTARLGPLGAAIASVLSTALVAIAAGAYVLPHFAVRLDWTSLGRVAVASAILYALTKLYLPGGALIAPYLVLLAGLYVVLLLSMGELTVSDVRQWRDALADAVFMGEQSQA